MSIKNLFSTVLFCFLMGTGLTAQDSAKALKDAGKSLSKYLLNGDSEVLMKAKDAIDLAFTDSEVSSKVGALITKGKIYNEAANNEFKLKTLNPEHQLSSINIAIDAFNAFNAAIGSAEKKKDKKDALTGIKEAEAHLNNYGILANQDKDYAGAFSNFSTSLSAADALQSMGETSRLDEVENGYTEQVFYTALTGYYGNMLGDAKPYFQKLYDMSYDEPLIYEAMYKIATEEGSDNPIQYLEAGREKYPDDSGILFSEINHYLASGNLETLISKLELAIEKEPDNVSVITTLGSVFDQLHQKASADGDEAKSNEYFDGALTYFNQALEKSPESFDATYSVGALYYNRAATYVEPLNELSADFSADGMKKYDAVQAEMNSYFTKALPFFERAESLNPEDLNTVIALKEIYARLDQLDKSEEYKAKYDKMTGGQ